MASALQHDAHPPNRPDSSSSASFQSPQLSTTNHQYLERIRLEDLGPVRPHIHHERNVDPARGDSSAVDAGDRDRVGHGGGGVASEARARSVNTASAGAPSEQSLGNDDQDLSWPHDGGQAGGGAKIERWNSTRRYIDQLESDEDDEDDAEADERGRFALENPIHENDEDEDEEDRNDVQRDSLIDERFHSWATDPRDTVIEPGSSHMQQYAAGTRCSAVDEGHHQLDSGQHPVVRIGPPSPGTEAFLSNPFDSAQWDDLASPSPTRSRFQLDEHGPTSLERSGARVTSQLPIATARNFSRPFRGPPLVESQADPNHRRLSAESNEHFTYMERSSSLGHSSAGHSSSLEHSSQGAHSLSSSWDERRQMDISSYAATRDAARAGMSSSRSGHMEELSTRMHQATIGERGPHHHPAPSPPPALSHANVFSTRTLPVEMDSSVLHSLPPNRTPQTSAQSQFSYAQPLVSPTTRAPEPAPVPMTPTMLRDSRLRMPGICSADNSPQAPQGSFEPAPDAKPRDRPSAPPFIASPPKERHGAWARFRSRSKSRGSKTPASPTDSRFQSVSAASAYSQSPSSAGPAITFDPPSRKLLGDLDNLATRARELTERRRRFDELKLQPSVARSVQAGFVHAGEAGVEPAWLAAAAQAEGEAAVEHGQDLLRPPNTSMRVPMMQRSVSDQGPGPREPRFLDNALEELRPTSLTQSLHSSYSQSSGLPGSPRIHSGTGSASPRSINVPSGPGFGGAGHQSTPSGPALETLRKAKSGLKEHGPLGSGRGAQGSDEYLQLGIEYHENGELSRAAWCFEQSAKRGSSSGMLMFGLTLQHGWGCRVDMPLGFRYLQSAAESVVEDLNRVVASLDEKATAGSTERTVRALQSELVLALHELGQSCRFGYGCAKDPTMAVSYFQLAADLGDPDAQNDLAFMYANGKGCKKNMKLAAKYYRLAIEQGMSDMGLSWVWKPKYD